MLFRSVDASFAQMRIVRSPEQVAMELPDGDQAAVQTRSVCPASEHDWKRGAQNSCTFEFCNRLKLALYLHRICVADTLILGVHLPLRDAKRLKIRNGVVSWAKVWHETFGKERSFADIS